MKYIPSRGHLVHGVDSSVCVCVDMCVSWGSRMALLQIQVSGFQERFPPAASDCGLTSWGLWHFFRGAG